MGFTSDIAGAYGISRTGIAAGAAKMIGVPEKAAHAMGLALELSRGMTKDGFDFSQVNKGALARHALKAFGMYSPMKALMLTAGLHLLPKGFALPALAGAGGVAALSSMFGGSAAAVGGSAISGAAVVGGGVLAGSALAGLSGMQLNMMNMLFGVAGVQPNDIAGGGMKFLFGNKTAQMRNLTETQRFNGGPGSQYAALPKPAFFEDIVAALMQDFVRDKQSEIEERMKKLAQKSEENKSANNQVTGAAVGTVGTQSGTVKNANDAATQGNSDSRNLEMEAVKYEMQKLTQMQQALSNILNTMHEEAQNAIRNIKA